ncbi:16S rRNA (cytosine(967)-C(5))-methyltransferase RsmB [Aerococcaceae bacterium NML201209]|nr:16S rRNA (cytosine(967)-C(5))-methyltransferase RsmB [Aerococcaceae bacterium NML201209]
MKIKKQAQQKLAQNVRWQALQLLDKVDDQGEYSNVLIDRFLKQSQLDERDNQLLVQLVYGTIQRRLTLDYYLQSAIHGKKMDAWVRSLLRMSVYQLVYLERIPAHAVLNEAVKIAKLNGHQALGNFVNAILRKVMREELPSFEQCETVAERLAVQYSVQPWIVADLLRQFSKEEVARILASLLEKPILSARISTLPEGRERIVAELQAEGFEVEASALSPYGIRCLKGNLIHSNAFKAGLLTIQDESSMLVAPLGQLTGNECVLDACSAPGGKATHIAQLLQDGHLTALDISSAKLAKVQAHLERLGLTKKVTLKVADASQFEPHTSQLYDMIYLDAPCSGLGLMRRKPEIKYEKQPEDVQALAEIQLTLLRHVATLLKKGGTLVYSTCTLTLEENEQVLATFMKERNDFVVKKVTAEEGIPANCLTEEGYVRVLPHNYHTDGFFIGRLTKL